MELTKNEIQSINNKYINELQKHKNQIILHITKQLENNQSIIQNNTNCNNRSTTNNNNITINNYGYENSDYITDKLLTWLVQRPSIAVRQLIEKMHFNLDHPENHNLKSTNQKSKYVQIMEGNTWISKDKQEVITDLIIERLVLNRSPLTVKALVSFGKHEPP